MERTVLKLDSIPIYDGARAAASIGSAVDSLDEPLVVVVPAFSGAAKVLAAAAEARARGPISEAPIAFLREGHLAVAAAMDAPPAALEAASLRIEGLLRRLRALLSLGGHRPRAEILAIGSRLSATCVGLALAATGRPAALVEPRELGLLASKGPRGPRIDSVGLGPGLRSALERFPSSVLPGDYGVDAEGKSIYLGGRGPDIVAAAIAAALGARLRGVEARADRACAPAADVDPRFARAYAGRSGPARASLARNPGVA